MVNFYFTRRSGSCSDASTSTSHLAYDL